MEALRKQERKLERELERLTKRSAHLAETRVRLPAGAPRKRVTSANARWTRAAEARDRVASELDALREQIEAEEAQADASPVAA